MFAIAALLSWSLTAHGAPNLAGESVALSTASTVGAAGATNSTATWTQLVAPKPPGLALSAGQVPTLLSDGTWLVSGGATGRATVSSQLGVFDPPTGRMTLLPAHLQVARAAHTATLLPDGTVLIHGGVDSHGLPIPQSEIFDRISGQTKLMDSTGLLARAHHAAAVLSDGRVLITGGVDPRGTPILSSEIFNPTTAQVDAFNGGLDTARLDATAAMLPNGQVLIFNGTDPQGKPVTACSLYDPAAQSFSSVNAAAAQSLALPLAAGGAAPTVATSLPTADAADVSVGAALMVRFSTRLNVATLNTATVTLIGPGGATPLKAIGVDSGVLLFVTPSQQLMPGSQYTLFVRGAQDNARRTLPLFSVGFKTQVLQATSRADSTMGSSGSAAVARSGSGSSVTHTQAALSGIDEEWIPEERHRHGAWMSQRAYLAQSSLPKQPDLRRLIQSHTPTVPDPASLVRAQAVSEQTPRVPRASWSELDAQAQSSDTIVQGQSVDPAHGVTALAGQVLRLNGLPLANVTMQVGTVSTFTDANGEFRLSGIASGNQVITIEGATANRPDATYGRFQYLFNVVAGKTNLLPFTIWMPKLDMKHAVRISSPTQQDTVISNPTMPGLSITLPKGTVVRGTDGKIVTEVSLTPIPVDQPPYPMPYTGVPLHYTLQPGGALIEGMDGKPQGAVVRYPNYTSFGPGTPMRLFDYDAKGRGWYVYSAAQVAANGSAITSDRDFLIYQFGTTSYSSGGPPPLYPPPQTCNAPPPGFPAGGGGGWQKDSNAGSDGSGCGGDPVDLQYGFFRHAERDLYLNDVIPIDVVRAYRASGTYGSLSPGVYSPLQKSFGSDMSNSYEAYLSLDPSGTLIQMVMGDASVISFTNPNGSQVPYPYDQLTYKNGDNQASYNAAIIYKDAASSSFIVAFKDGRHWGFSAYSARLIWLEDRIGNRLTLARPNVNSYVSRVTSPHGRYVDFGYNTLGLVSTLTDNLGRQFQYQYTTNNSISNLTAVVDPNTTLRGYGWDNNFLASITDPNGNLLMQNTFESIVVYQWLCEGSYKRIGYTGRILSQKLADGSQFSYSYNSKPIYTGGGCVLNQLVGIAPSTSSTVTDRRGAVRQVAIDAKGNITSDTHAVGKPEQQLTTFAFDPATNLLASKTDTLNRQTTYQYDGSGNLGQVTMLAGTANAVSVSATFDPAFNQPLTLTDANGLTTTLGYDFLGNLISVKDALGHTTRLGYDSEGHVTSLTNATGKTTSMTYSNGDLSSIKDPVGRQVQFLTDGAGRVMTRIDGLGNRTYESWDVLNRLTQVTDALGGVTKLGYDSDGRVLTQTDANGHATTFSYWPLGQLKTRQDALLNVESDSYEPGGQLSQRIDRKGQVAGVTYDALGRVATIGFGATPANPTAYTSTTTLSWDGGNRLTQIVDVQNGLTTTIKRGYDGLNRLTSEITDQGEVDSTYDNGGRRKTLTIKNGAAGSQTVGQRVTYTYDNGNRLTKIVQAAGPANAGTAQNIVLDYDAADLLLTRTATSGLVTAYTYTAADEVASITLISPTGTVLQTGSYTYDAAGRRTSVTGDLASYVQASGPTVTDAAYNANNELTRWSGNTFNYDANGNLGSDGVNTYTWDARDQLRGIAGGTTASFQYDAMRRRLAKTVSGAATAYLYDGANFVQELAGLGNTATVNANLLDGGLDEVYLRSMGTGSAATLHWVLPEANNSTIVLTDASGGVQKSYAYDPYGNTTPGAGADNNSQQYTGRENDANGLYFYRARYYMPGCMRFISEDPIGWASGQTNNYAYNFGNPVQFVDPTGRNALVGAALLAVSLYGSYRSGCEAGQAFAKAQQDDAIARAQQNENAENGLGQPVNEQQVPARTIANAAPYIGPMLTGFAKSVVLGSVGGAAAGGGWGALGGAIANVVALGVGFVNGANGGDCGIGLSIGMHPFSQTYSIF